jgi:hypothetical protein
MDDQDQYRNQMDGEQDIRLTNAGKYSTLDLKPIETHLLSLYFYEPKNESLIYSDSFPGLLKIEKTRGAIDWYCQMEMKICTPIKMEYASKHCSKVPTIPSHCKKNSKEARFSFEQRGVDAEESRDLQVHRKYKIMMTYPDYLSPLGQMNSIGAIALALRAQGAVRQSGYVLSCRIADP